VNLTRRSRLAHHLGTAFLWTAVALVAFPLVLMVLNAFKPHLDILENPLSLPKTLDTSNFTTAWQGGNFSRGLVNSIVVSGSTVLIAVGSAALIAYPLARRKLRNWRLLTFYFLAAVTVPIQLFLFPLFFLYARLGLVSNPVATAFILAAINLPISILLLRTYVLNIPGELDDAALMDGASKGQIFFYVVLPLIRPGLITVSIIVGLQAWNEYLITSTFQQSRDSLTMTLGYLSINNVILQDRGLLMAGAAILVVPIIVFFLALQRLFIEGMTSGAVKG
jgi:raffinose/stachyose/melibiose transport system permease protein